MEADEDGAQATKDLQADFGGGMAGAFPHPAL